LQRREQGIRIAGTQFGEAGELFAARQTLHGRRRGDAEFDWLIQKLAAEPQAQRAFRSGD
jgi:hypothetical protein